MASLQGLPPLPKSLRGLLDTGSTNWKEAEKMHEIKSSVISYGDGEAVLNNDAPHELETVIDSGRCPSRPPEPGQPDTKPSPPGFNSLQSAIAFLRHEMTDLRHLDISLLCQLWTLSESIQEYKQVMSEKFSETNSTCSSHSLDNGIESLDAIEENEYENSFTLPAPPKPNEENMYENGQFHRRSVNLSNHFDRIRTPEVRPLEIAPIREPDLPPEEYEPVYLEPVPSLYKEIVIPHKRPSASGSSRTSNSPSPQKTQWTSYPYHHNTTYESSC